MTDLLPLLLASASPRRRQLITQLGLPFTVGIPPTDEDKAQESYQGPIEGLALWTAQHKAMAALSLPEAANRLVITADTTVLRDHEVLGKPRDQAHARELLLSLRNRWHTVVTSVVVSALLDGKPQIHGASCATPVLMRDYSEAEVMAYIDTGDPMDKAGAYGIQHPSFQPTARIDGCYLSVVGFPLCLLTALLSEFGIQPANSPPTESRCPWSQRCTIDRCSC